MHFQSQYVLSMSLLITQTFPGSGISARMCICPLPSGSYLAAFQRHLILPCFLIFFSTFKNLAYSKILKVEKIKKQKNKTMVAIKNI